MVRGYGRPAVTTTQYFDDRLQEFWDEYVEHNEIRPVAGESLVTSSYDICN
ncbi:hypothetical protein MMC07_007816 [Pseudocyphellaria aurata]|nr:hypothetical protein [Pseudocyphellaria aurata]